MNESIRELALNSPWLLLQLGLVALLLVFFCIVEVCRYVRIARGGRGSDGGACGGSADSSADGLGED